jgi:predicted ATPase
MPKPANNWYVITGGPSAGKTTVLNELAKRGHAIQPEIARAIIEADLAKGKTMAEIRGDNFAFQMRIYHLKCELEATLPKQQLTFFDRALHDTIPYLQMSGHTASPEVVARLNQAAYRKCFLMDLLDFEQDAARIESPEEALKVHRLLEEAYRDTGHEVIRVPILPVPERTDFILANLEPIL